MSDTRGLVQFDAAGRVAEDVPCVRCGYNLRTLDPEAKCPECGVVVRETLRSRRLYDAEGFRKAAYGAVFMLLAMLMGGVVAVLVAFRALGLGLHDKELLYVSMVMSSGFGLFGCLGLTVDHRRLKRAEKRVRWWARSLFSLGVAGWVYGFVSDVYPMIVLSIWSVGVGVVATFLYVSRLAAHISQYRLAAHCRLIGGGLGIGFIALSGLVALHLTFAPDISWWVAVDMIFLALIAIWSLPVLWFCSQRFAAIGRRLVPECDFDF